MERKLVAVYTQPSSKLIHIYSKLGATLVPIYTISQVETVIFSHVLLRGGSDINPSLYRQKLTYSVGLDPYRDRVEWAMLDKAHEEKLPVLGICRGMQLLNVFYGGSLYQDIYQAGVTICNHTNTEHELDWKFDVSFPEECTSRHHQGVKRLAKGFTILAESLDGIPEIIFRNRVLGIQGHPEDYAYSKSGWWDLFDWHLEGFRVQKP